MQLKVLLKKDLSALFKQKAVIFTLIFPMIILMFIAVIPSFVDSSEPFEVGYLIEDDGIIIANETLNLGDLIFEQITETFNNDESLILVELENKSAFINYPNALWVPSNFTHVANETREARYFITMSDTNIRAKPVMTGVISQIIDNIVTTNLIPVVPPTIVGEQVFAETELLDGQAKNRGDIAFPLAYIAFLILIMGSSSMRLTGFSAEREADMLELMLSSVIHRRELILSKLITGVLYGFASVMSYLIGFGVVILLNKENLSNGDFNFINISPDLINVTNILILIFLFVTLSFISIEILLASQLVMGREGGEKFGSMGLMIMTIMFYVTSITDPLAETPIQVINPFFWPFKITLNVIFRENVISSLIYLSAIVILTISLLVIQTKAIENEKVLFE